MHRSQVGMAGEGKQLSDAHAPQCLPCTASAVGRDPWITVILPGCTVQSGEAANSEKMTTTPAAGRRLAVRASADPRAARYVLAATAYPATVLRRPYGNHSSRAPALSAQHLRR